MLRPWLFETLRLFFGFIFLATSLGKLLDNRGFAAAIANYHLGIPSALLLWVALAVGLIELALAVSLLAGWRQRITTAVALGWNLLYLAVTGATLARGLRVANSAFLGVFDPAPLGWKSLAQSLLLSALALALWLGARRFSRRSRSVFR